MVVFKKPSKAVPASSPRTAQSPDKSRTKLNTTVTSERHASTDKASPASIRYSDIAAGRDAKDSDTHIEKLMYIPELCDEVLDYLAMSELLHATRVCHAFKTNIENSSRLQAKLFFAPDLTTKKLAISATGTLLSGVKAEQRIAVAEAAGGSGSGEISFYEPHPWLRASRLSDRYRRMGMVKYATVYLETGSDDNAAALFFRQRPPITPLSDTSSLNKMFLCQPPSKEVTLWYPGLGMYEKKTICSEEGVTIGEVVGAARRMPSEQYLIPRSIEIVLEGGFAIDPRARIVVERAGELSAKDDPTRWLLKDDEYVLQDGGFAFV